MFVIKIDTSDTRSDPTLSIVTLAKTREEIGPKAIGAVVSILAYSRPEDLTYYPVSDRDAYVDDFDGNIVQLGSMPTHYNVYIKETESPEDLIVSGNFLDTRTVEDQKLHEPHVVLIVNKETPDRREIGFPNYFSAVAFAEKYDANAASLNETLFIEDQNGVTIKKYG